MKGICASYFEAVEKDRIAVEQALEEEAKKAEAEKYVLYFI